MTNLNGKVFIVTGAYAGIGKAVSERLVSLGGKVVGCARNIDRLNEVANELNKKGPGQMLAVKCDVSKEEEILSMFKTVKEKYNTLHAIVNNAGISAKASILNGKTSDWENVTKVNVLGVAICSREAYKLMKQSNVDDGHIINLNSYLGKQVSKHADSHWYNVTKYAVTAITEGLRQELRAEKSHIRVTSILPGLVETEFSYRMNPDNPDMVKKFYSHIACLQPEDIADSIIYALSAPPRVDVSEILVRPTEQES